MVMIGERWLCGAFQPTRNPARAYRCTRKWGHLGDHKAENDEGEALAEWPHRHDLWPKE